MQRSTYISLFVAAALLAALPGLHGQQAGPRPFDSRSFGLRLRQRITVAWHGQQLGVVFQRLAETQDIALWLDRRVDPQQHVTAQFNERSVQQVLERLAHDHSLGIVLLENLVYIGPEQSAREMATLLQRAHDSLAAVPRTQRKAWLRAAPSDWPRLSQPRSLLTELLDDAGIRLVGSEQIAHDLWQAKQLPPLPLVDRVVLVLAGFDRTCRISPDGRSCEVVPIKRPMAVGRQPKSSPPASSRPRSTRAEQKFSLRLKNQAVGRVIEQLARQLKLEVVWNDDSLSAAKLSRDTLVSCKVKDVGLDELLENILEPAKMRCRREGNRIEIEAAP